MSTCFSSPTELQQIAQLLRNYARLPFSELSIPGGVMEGTLAHVRRANVLRTYDFVDVVNRKARIGWQVKSTREATPVTWKRAKIPGRLELIAASEGSPKGLAALGNAIIDFCNVHAQESIAAYGLDEIGYSRLIVRANGTALYFERVLCTRDRPILFDPTEFKWEWSNRKNAAKKEQLSALHGFHQPTGRRWFAWHGRGENQLHFTGESHWWPKPEDTNAVEFQMPSDSDRIPLEAFIDLLAGKPLQNA